MPITFREHVAAQSVAVCPPSTLGFGVKVQGMDQMHGNMKLKVHDCDWAMLSFDS
jgi:hypothetical protein